MNRDALRLEFLAWLNRRFAPDGPVIEASTLLFKEGRIDSIGVLHLIAWVERALDREVPDRMIRLDHFESADRISERFFSGDGP